MKFKKVVSKRVRTDEEGVQIDAQIDAVIAANVGEPGAVNKVTNRSRTTERQDRSKASRSEEKDGKGGWDGKRADGIQEADA